jgi:hypothetical protein
MATTRFWQRRSCNFGVFSERKRIERLRYIHGNHAHRALVERPEDWPGAAFVTMRREKSVWWKSNHRGAHDAGNAQGSC